MKPALLLAMPALLLLTSCGDTPRVAGGVDGNPNFLEGRLVLPDSASPAARIPVVLSSSDGNAARPHAATAWIPRDTAWTDSNGCYRFPLSIDGRYRLQARVGDSLVISLDVDFSTTCGKRMEDAVVPLPFPGTLVVADFEPRATSASLAPWFSDAYGLRLLHNDSTRIAITPQSILSNPESGIADCGEQGNCYHMATTLVAADALYDLTEIYESFRPSPSGCFDLSRADSLTLRVRGTGNMLVSWWGKDAALSKTTWSMPNRLLPLTPEWRTISLPTDSIRFDWGTDTIPWSGSCLHKITFGLRGQGDLWLDDIRLHGATLLDLQTP